MRISLQKELKTLWQREKLLVLSNFSFCHDVFKSRQMQGRQKASICGKGLSWRNFKFIAGLTLFHIQQIRNIWLWKCLLKNMENLWVVVYLLKRVEILWQKKKLLVLFWAISSFATVFSKIVCCRGVRKRLYVGKGIKASNNPGI